MANANDTTAQVVGRAKTVISQTRRKGEELATQLAKKPAVRQARKKVARVRGQAAALANPQSHRTQITGRARRRKRARVAAAVVGAAAVATAAGIRMARKRKR